MTSSEEKPRHTIVVGVDGSEESKRALRWAARQARRSGARLKAVEAYTVPASIFVTPAYTEIDYADEAQRELEQSIEEALGEDLDVELETELMQGPPSRVLVRASGQAELLVLGGRGRGELLGELHLEPVTSYVVHHAPCPVVVVRNDLAS